MRYTRFSAMVLALALISAGCGGKAPELMLQRLDPKAPAASGMPPTPAPEQPVPLTERLPFGLYANYPSRDTLERLSRGELSPDGRYRAAMTDQGAWVTRIDGAWLWQIQLPAPNQQPAAPATAPPTPVIIQGTKLVGTLKWTPQSRLVAQDDAGTWLEADPETARIAPLPAALQGKGELLFSPDGKQAMYYVTGKTAKQLWVVHVDGTNAKLLGENVTGRWGPDGNPVVEKIPVPTTPPPGAPTTPAAPPKR